MAGTGKAMIFAAGLGTRLQPLTLLKPKALAEIDGVTLLEYAIRNLMNNGFDHIVVNVHHFANQVVDFLKSKNNFDINISISDESNKLLDTGGGLKNASDFFDDNRPFLVYNVDVLTDLNLRELYASHQKSNVLATLAVRNRKTSRYFLFDQNDSLCGWKNMATNEIKIKCTSISKLRPFAFSGIQVINHDIFNMMSAYDDCFSITDVYLNLCASYKIKAYNHDKSFWMDLGTVEHIKEADELLSKYNFLLMRE
ncbi:MAG: nucleotidyltransferase family protein [Bacteroidia bacterium]|nr:nucleotidyltransferase family protein [Bacteroidia bacterium]